MTISLRHLGFANPCRCGTNLRVIPALGCIAICGEKSRLKPAVMSWPHNAYEGRPEAILAYAQVRYLGWWQHGRSRDGRNGQSVSTNKWLRSVDDGVDRIRYVRRDQTCPRQSSTTGGNARRGAVPWCTTWQKRTARQQGGTRVRRLWPPPVACGLPVDRHQCCGGARRPDDEFRPSGTCTPDISEARRLAARTWCGRRSRTCGSMTRNTDGLAAALHTESRSHRFDWGFHRAARTCSREMKVAYTWCRHAGLDITPSTSARNGEITNPVTYWLGRGQDKHRVVSNRRGMDDAW